MKTNGYWERFTDRRVSRRRALAFAGGSAAAAAFLAACGGDDDSDSDSTGSSSGSSSGSGASSGGTGQASSSPIYTPVDTSAQGKQGGSWTYFSSSDITHFDALIANSFQTVDRCSIWAYNRLLKFSSGIYPDVADGMQEPEMAESWELSADKLTLTMKIRRGDSVKWDDREPTNGREMDMEDILYSYHKFAELNPSGANIDNNRNPAAPVISAEAPDDSTLVFKLARPDATIVPLFSATDHLYIMPRESDGQFDPANTVRGNGPWLLDEYEPSVRFRWKRNPNYYVPGRPFPDFVDRPIVTEAAQRLTQFRAGNILHNVAGPNDVIQLWKDVPEANLYLRRTLANSLSPSVWFGYEGDSPFKDQRVRQAFSMLVDREGFTFAALNADRFEAEGLGIEASVNTVITAGWGPYWLDPMASEFGDAAKYLQLNVEEAKALITAAGYPDGVTTTQYFNSAGSYGEPYPTGADLYANFFRDGGNEINQVGLDYTEFLNSYYFGYRSGASTRGAGEAAEGYNGYSVQAERPYATAINLMLGSWHPGGSSFHGYTPDGNNPTEGDSSLTAMIEDSAAEFDSNTQISRVHDIIRYMTEHAYFIPKPTVAPTYELYWPALSGVGWRERWPNNALPTEEAIDWWIDETQPPFA
jgi:ABC-type transport system substrate-binding protein